jgi:hypothetical protein
VLIVNRALSSSLRQKIYSRHFFLHFADCPFSLVGIS